MKNDDPLFIQKLYTDHLTVIDGIHFTPREIDIMACLLNLRGTSKIASLLSIAPTTVFTHTHNVMRKVGCSSRDDVLDFIEKSPERFSIKKHYSSLVISTAFEKSLHRIAKLKRIAHQGGFIVKACDQFQISALMQHLESHLKQVGLCVKAQELIPDQIQLSFSFEKENQEQHEAETYEEISLTKQHDYYALVFLLLETFFSSKELNIISSAFQKTYKSALQSLKSIPSLEKQEGRLGRVHEGALKDQNSSFLLSQKGRSPLRISFTFSLRNSLVLMGLLLLLICLMGGSYFTSIPQDSIRSNLLLPDKAILLHRPALIAQIEDTFKQQDGIKAVTLVGMGGIGKTTLARQYARAQPSTIAWQIKAETLDSLKASFENLAYALAQTEEDKKVLLSLQDIENPADKDERLLFFVQKRMKAHPHWLLIYDDVETFEKLLPYFPNDPTAWGAGKIILTTRDINFQNNTWGEPHGLDQKSLKLSFSV